MNDRDALVRSAFDAHVDLLFEESRGEHVGDITLPAEQVDSLRQRFRLFMEQHWEEWQEVARKYPDAKLQGMLHSEREHGGKLGLDALRNVKDQPKQSREIEMDR